MPDSYLDWCEKVKNLSPADLSGIPLNSENTVRRVVLNDGYPALLKTISPQRPYVPRIKALGEVAYALFDYLLGPAGRITPYVYAQSPVVIWRSWIRGQTGQDWRGSLYGEFADLERADKQLVSIIKESPAARRIALLDFIFLCQDRSGRNWLRDAEGHFWAIDNGLFWTYRGRFADKRTIKTGEVDHLQHPLKALVYTGTEFQFRNGIFSSLYAGRPLNEPLEQALAQIDWDRYLFELSRLVCAPLVYGYELVDDWRFLQLRRRAEWILARGQMPDAADLEFWYTLIDRPSDGKEIWKRAWEIRHLETV